MKNKIFVALSTFGEYGKEPIDLLKNSEFDYKINTLNRRLVKKEIIEMAQESIGIIAGVEPYDKEVFEGIPNLKCISRAGVGIDNIDLKYANKYKITICNTPDVVIRPVAELALAMIFDILRKTTFHTILLKKQIWKKSAGNLLLNRNVGIIGTGKIGKLVGELLVKLGANVIANDIVQDNKWAEKNKVQYCSFQELLSKSEIISIHANPSKKTLPLIGGNEIKLMKRGVILINTSRGDCIDENSLIDGLNNGKVGALGADVFSEEPYNGELINFENVVLTPHLATLTKESRLEMEVQATKNLLNTL